MTEEANRSWTATTDLKSSDANPTRIIESHSQNGNRTLDKRSVQIRGFDGHFENFQYIETETLQLDPTINDTVQPGPSGFRSTRTVRLRDLNGNCEVVEVDTAKSDKVLTIQFQQTPTEKP